MSRRELHVTAVQTRRVVRCQTGVVVPVYISEGPESGLAQALVEDTVRAYCDQVVDPATICVSVDGPGRGVAIAQGLASALGVSLVIGETNRGKLAAARAGARVLLRNPDVRYVAIVDQDGDHFPNELANLVRAAEHVQEAADVASVLALGCRSSRHRPMGFPRGEHEDLADRVLLDALHYHAAETGQPLRLEFTSTVTDVPDFHSGFKLMSRRCAVAVFESPPEMAGQGDDCYYRHAVEAVMIVEAIVRGAVLAAVGRSTLNEQPYSTFGEYERCQLVADMMVWPCKRLNIPAHFVGQWLANHVPPLLLNTLAPEGQEELRRIVELTVTPFGPEAANTSDDPARPLFV